MPTIERQWGLVACGRWFCLSLASPLAVNGDQWFVGVGSVSPLHLLWLSMEPTAGSERHK